MGNISIGLHQARVLCNMVHDERLLFLADGLPAILASARSLWQGSSQLPDEMKREAAVLHGLASEEAAKALILMDAVRCPKHIADRRMGKITGWFYSHLARLLYAAACEWRPSNLADLREYIDHERKTHYLEGEFSEYIAPNWALHQRESVLYVDIEVTEHDGPRWSSPYEAVSIYGSNCSSQPDSLCLVEAMDKVGIFTPAGLKATSEVWGQVEFIEEESRVDDHRLKNQLFGRLDREKLTAHDVTERHVQALVDLWRLPMYNLELREIPTSLDEVEEERELVLHNLL